MPSPGRSTTLALGALVVAVTLSGCQQDPDVEGPGRGGSSPTISPTISPTSNPTSNPAVCRGTVALTFDDGPAPGATPDLLAVLDRLDVPAAFFMIGRRVDAHPALARAVAQAGYAVGNHTYDHEDLTALPPVAAARTLRRTDRALARAGVPPTRLVRLPFGRTDDAVAALLRRDGRAKVGWNTPSNDGSRDAVGITAGQLTDRVLGRLRPGRANVVLQHDGGPVAAETIAAVPAIVAGARTSGYCVVGLGSDGEPLPPG